MNRDIIVIHPYKHHIYPAVASLQQNGFDVQFITLFYQKGLFAKAISLIPGKIGRKAKGYYNQKIERQRVLAPINWQWARLFHPNQEGVLKSFDRWCAANIISGYWQARAFHLLQDYLPETAQAIIKVGAVLVSDQILNASTEAREHLAKSLEMLNATKENHFAPIETANDWILAHANHILVPSEYIKQGIAGRAKTEKITILPYGVDVTAFVPKQNRNIEQASSINIVASANSSRKGGHLLIPALAHLGDKLSNKLCGKQIKVNIIGKLSKIVKQIYTEYQPAMSASSVNITYSEVAHSDMPNLLSNADLFIMPSLSEGMSLLLIEAAACELPLIITPYCGIDAFESNKHGFMIEDTTEEHIAKALLQASENYLDWPHMGKAARQMALGYSRSHYESNMTQFYRNILGI